MRRLVGITRKKPKQAPDAVAIPDDLVYFEDSDVHDTPCGAARPFDPPSALDDVSLPSSPSSANSSITFVDAPAGDPSGRCGSEQGDDIYAHLYSFEDKLESELQDLERFGVSSGAPLTPIQEIDLKCGRRDTGGGREASPTAPAGESKTPDACADVAADPGESELLKGNGKSGKDLAMLSGKTDKIMSAYQAYLAEIDDLSSGSEDSCDPEDVKSALQNVYFARESVRDSYDDRQFQTAEEGGAAVSDDGSSAGSAGRDEGYAAGAGEPLYRAWGYEDSTGSPNENSSIFLGGEGLFRGGRSYRRMYVPHPWLRTGRVRRALSIMVAVATIGFALGVLHQHRKNRDVVDGSPPDLEAAYQSEIAREEDEKGKLHAMVIKESEMQKKVAASPQAKATPAPNGAEPGGISSLQEKEIAEEGGTMALAPEAEEAEFGLWYEVYGEEMEAGEEEDQIYEEEQTNNDPVVSEVMAEDGMEEGTVEVLEPIITILPEPHQEDEDASRPVPADPHIAEAMESYIDEEQMVKNALAAAVEPLEQRSSEELAAAFIEAQTSEMDLYYRSVLKYRPVMYDRSKGWTGRTYRDALLFCEFQGGLAVCPYDAICPDGRDGEPLGGFRDETNSDWAWLPVVGDYNEWVQGGARERCVRYTEKYGGEGPEWGITGKGGEVEGITRNIMCCVNAM